MVYLTVPRVAAPMTTRWPHGEGEGLLPSRSLKNRPANHTERAIKRSKFDHQIAVPISFSELQPVRASLDISFDAHAVGTLQSDVAWVRARMKSETHCGVGQAELKHPNAPVVSACNQEVECRKTRRTVHYLNPPISTALPSR